MPASSTSTRLTSCSRARRSCVAVAHISNVLGTINPVAEIARRAHAAGAVVLVDGSQAVPQIPVDLRELDADFYVWTGHKAYGPTGIGVLHGRRALLEEMPPFISGGHMIRQVFDDHSTWAELPGKYEAGTSAIAEAIGLGAAVDVDRGARDRGDPRARGGADGRGARAARDRARNHDPWARGGERPRRADLVRARRAPIPTTSARSWVATACACAPVTTARSR